MNTAIIKSTGEQVSILSVNGGWTTVISMLGIRTKVRNNNLELMIAIDNFEVERAESDGPSHNDFLEGNTLDDIVPPQPKVDDSPKLRHVKAATYNPKYMRKLLSGNGNMSFDCGDALARKLQQKSLEEVYDIAAEQLEVSRAELVAKYQHLNAGMQRMNLGNRLRAKASKAAQEHIKQLEAAKK